MKTWRAPTLRPEWVGLSHSAARTLSELYEVATESGYCPVRDLPPSMSVRHRRRALDELGAAGLGYRVHGGFVLGGKAEREEIAAMQAAGVVPPVGWPKTDMDGRLRTPPIPPLGREEEKREVAHPLVVYFRKSAERFLDAHRTPDVEAENAFVGCLLQVYTEGWLRSYIDWWVSERLYGPVWSIRACGRSLAEYVRMQSRSAHRRAHAEGRKAGPVAQTTLWSVEEIPLLTAAIDVEATKRLRSWAAEHDKREFVPAFVVRHRDGGVTVAWEETCVIEYAQGVGLSRKRVTCSSRGVVESLWWDKPLLNKACGLVGAVSGFTPRVAILTERG